MALIEEAIFKSMLEIRKNMLSGISNNLVGCMHKLAEKTHCARNI